LSAQQKVCLSRRIFVFFCQIVWICQLIGTFTHTYALFYCPIDLSVCGSRIHLTCADCATRTHT
jgi:hypothetical protein